MPLYHWYVKFVPIAATLKLAEVPVHVITATGCVLIAVVTLEEIVATALVTVLQLLLTTT